MPAGTAPDDPAAISALARSHAHAALEALVAALDNAGERVPAAIALLNADYGAPVQPIALDSVHGISIELSEAPRQRTSGEGSSAWSARLRERQS
jgi:hypothetical protein